MAGHFSVVPHVECHKRIRTAVDRRLEHHLVVRSRSCGRHRKCVSTGSAIAITAVTKASTCRWRNPAARRCSPRWHTASYSLAKGTLNSRIAPPWRIDRRMAADAPAGLRIAATTTSVSKVNLASPYHDSLLMSDCRSGRSSGQADACVPFRSQRGVKRGDLTHGSRPREQMPTMIAHTL
jgi:hypothetical protein